jgi:cellulose synthase operon protein C
MLKVECESCKAPYQVDERRVPATGLKMRCPKCGHTFVVGRPAAVDAAPAPGPSAPASHKSDQKTIVGVGVAPIPSAPPAPRPVAPPLPAPSAQKPADAFPTSDSFPAALGTLDDADLPAIPDAAALPVAVARKPAPVGGARPKTASSASPAPAREGLFGEIDLPAPVVGLPATRPQPPARSAAARARELGFGGRPGAMRHEDLPARRPPPPPGTFGAIEADLPSLAGDLPAPAQNLPSPRAGSPRVPGASGRFGEIDLPALVNDLPASQNNLPMPQMAGLPALQNNLPVPQNSLPMAQPAGQNLPALQNSLPMAQPAGQNLPLPARNQNLLPQVAPNQNLLPTIGDFGELDLPRPQPVEMQLPTVQTQQPMQSAPPPDFGELDLPGPGDRPMSGGPLAPFASEAPPRMMQAPSRPAPGPGPSYPFAPPMPPPTPPPPADRRVGGLGFGEVDLGGDPGDSGAVGTEVRLSSGPGPAGAVGTLAAAEELRAREAAARRAPTVVTRRPSAAPKIALAVVGLLVVGGALLQLTSVGAFGYLWIGDKVNAREYTRAAQQGAEKARARMGVDTYVEARGAVDELAVAHARLPRSRPLAAYAALAQFMTELRFGKDGAAEAKANQWLAEIPPNAEKKYTPVAQAAQAALAGDVGKARRSLDLASKEVGNDPLAVDIALTRGEVELIAKDGVAAVAAFKKAAEVAPVARAHFGVARAYALSGDLQKAKEAAERALKASPGDAGALTLRAKIAWQIEHDEASATKDLGAVIEAPAKTASPAELAQAHALRGWIWLSRDRAADARAQFDEALKLDARSVLALVGQGEVLYQDGRFNEALGRFDTALQTEPLSIEAIIGDAKTQISLERLADAKKQLKAAREKFPRDMRLALWLGKAEEALGDKKAAEDDYLAAIDLADVQDPDAVKAYATLAALLAQQGRAPEAEAKLAQARERLPDSAALQRAFAEIAAAQGQYERAVAYYEQCLAKDPRDAGTRFQLGITLRRMRRFDRAAREFDEVFGLDKEFPGLSLERGLLYEASGEAQKALEMFQGALAKAPNDPDLQLRVGAAFVATGRPDEGLEILKKVQEQRPNSAELQYYMGRAYLAKGQLQEANAMRYLKKAADLDPFRAEYHLYLAWAANEATAADPGLARAEVGKALNLDKLNGDAYWQLGEVELKQGQNDDAIRHAKRALELKPGRYEAYATLGEAYYQKSDVGNALASYKKAIEADDKHLFWRYRYGRLLFDKNAMVEAAKHLQYAAIEAEKLTPIPGWFADADFHAGQALQRTGKKAEAIERYQRYLEMAGPSAPDRREATAALQQLGAPYDSRGF